MVGAQKPTAKPRGRWLLQANHQAKDRPAFRLNLSQQLANPVSKMLAMKTKSPFVQDLNRARIYARDPPRAGLKLESSNANGLGTHGTAPCMPQSAKSDINDIADEMEVRSRFRRPSPHGTHRDTPSRSASNGFLRTSRLFRGRPSTEVPPALRALEPTRHPGPGFTAGGVTADRDSCAFNQPCLLHLYQPLAASST